MLLEVSNTKIIYLVVAGIGMSIFFLSALMKTKVRLLVAQVIAHVFNMISWAIMGAWTAIVPEATNAIRNLFIIGKKNTKIISILLIVISSLIGILINVFADNNQLVGYLPILASFQFSVVVLIPNIKLPYVKMSMIVSNICFIIYSVLTDNIVFVIANALTLAASLVAIIMYYVKKEKSPTDENEVED